MIVGLVCSDPQLSFRQFYAAYFIRPGENGSFRWGYPGETHNAVFIRTLNAQADYVEYRIARAEKCGAKR